MQSMSTSDGTYSLVVTFKVGTDLDFAQVLVQNRVSAALSSLPDAVQKQGVTVKKQSTSILHVRHPDVAGRHVSTACILRTTRTIRLKDELARLPGVGSVLVFGAGQYSMRIWLDPEKLKARGLTTQDVTQALQQQNQQVAAGQIGAPPAPADTALPVHGERGRPARRCRPVREHHREDRQRRRDHARARRRPRRARRTDLRPVSRSTASRPPASPCSSRRARTRSTSSRRCASAWMNWPREFPQRADRRDSVRHHAVRR